MHAVAIDPNTNAAELAVLEQQLDSLHADYLNAIRPIKFRIERLQGFASVTPKLTVVND